MKVKSKTAVYFEQMKQMQMFFSLTTAELDSLVDKIVFRQYKKNEMILQENDSNNFMYLILSGRVKAVQTTDDGKEIIRAIHKTGDSFGELSLIDCKSAAAAVITMKSTTAAIISKMNFFSILYSQKKVLDNLLLMFCTRLRDAFDKLDMSNFKSAYQRITALLQQLSHEYGVRVQEGIMLDIKLTHQNLADMSGLTRETVTRALNRLQKDGEITIKNKKTIYLNPSFPKEFPS
jgi:CRP/FNR family transcriptional regulator, cyclic AMP receptor protein